MSTIDLSFSIEERGDPPSNMRPQKSSLTLGRIHIHLSIVSDGRGANGQSGGMGWPDGGGWMEMKTNGHERKMRVTFTMLEV